jgi:2',3'-cyclic-nucleotide 2'-phosphodiesterase (5'-nucleotidase family)
VLGANLFYRGTEHPYAQPWTIIERGGVRVGVVGLLGQDAATALIPSHIAGVDVRDPADVLREHVARLRDEVDLLVVLIHQGPTAPMQTDDEADPRVFRGNVENLALAGSVPGVDVILAGHTDAGTEQPLVHPATGTRIMQTWGQGQHLGRLTLVLDEQGNVLRHRGELIPVDAGSLEADSAVARRLTDWRARYPDLRDIVGHTDGTIIRRYYDESPLGNLFADIAREATAAEIGLMPSGALRRDLPAGDVHRVELIDAFPFEDSLARVRVSGSVLLAILEQGFSLERGLLQVSGLRVAYAPERPVGERVVDVCVGSSRLEPDRLYSIGTVEIIARGGDAYRQFLEADAVELLPTPFATVLEDALGSRPLTAAPALGRLSAQDSPLSCGMPG